MNFGFARVFVKGHTTSVTILLNDLNGVECVMANVSRKILMNLDMMLPIFSVAWHWMLKTCIPLSITRVGSLQLCSMHATFIWQNREIEPQTNNIVVGLLLHKTSVVVHSPREIAGTVWNSIDVTNLRSQSFQRRNLNDEGVGKSTWIFHDGKEVTMARVGILPDFLYQREIEVGERIDLSSISVATTDISSVSSITDGEEVTELDSSSDEEICEGTSDLGNQQITWHVDFLVGVTSPLGQQVRVNSRFVL